MRVVSDLRSSLASPVERALLPSGLPALSNVLFFDFNTFLSLAVSRPQDYWGRRVDLCHVGHVKRLSYDGLVLLLQRTLGSTLQDAVVLQSRERLHDNI
jgi:hypothetical protein